MLLRVLLIVLILLYPSVVYNHELPLPDLNRPKVQEDIYWAAFHKLDPILVLAWIAKESGFQSVSENRREKDDLEHTRVKSHTGDYGRHQINCRWWKARQRLWEEGHRMYKDFPPQARIEACGELYNDFKNRVAFYYIVRKYRDTFSKKKKWGVPLWIGHYQTGYAAPNDHYLKSIGHIYGHFRKGYSPSS